MLGSPTVLSLTPRVNMQKVCYLDLDGVLVDFVGGSLKLHGKHIPPSEVLWDFPQQVGFAGTWVSEFWDPLGHQFWANLKWTFEGPSLLASLEKLFGAENVVLMTSPCETPGSVEGKVEWIKKHCPGYARRFFVGPPKHLAAGPNKVLVDDHEGNTDKFEQHGGRTVLVPRPWNRRKPETCPLGRFDVGRLVEELERVVQ